MLPIALGETDDDALLLAIAAGSRTAFRQMMERHAAPMLRLAGRTLANPADADEVVQEAFLKVWTLAAQWQPDGAAKFSTWLYRVVLNLCIDRHRRPATTSLDGIDEQADAAPNGLDQAMGQQSRRLVHAALAELPSRQQAALTLYYFGEVSGPEAARILQMSIASLESLLLRGRRSLKKALGRRGIIEFGDMG